MAFNNLSTGTMVAISERWLDPRADRPVLERLSLVAPLLPIIEQVHSNLIVKQNTTSSIEAAIDAIQERQRQVDTLHDRKMRGTHLVLTGFAELTNDREQAERLLDLRDRLMPEGRQATRRSYLDQAGDAKMLPGRLTESARQLLDALPTPNGTLKQEVQSWLDAAAELGGLDRQRASLERKRAAGESNVTPAKAQEAKNAWIRVARAIEANLALDPDASYEAKERLLAPLYRAEAKADRRRATGAQPTSSPTSPMAATQFDSALSER